MLANAQRDGRPAEYRWRPLPSVKRRKVSLTPATRDRAATLLDAKPVEVNWGAQTSR